MTSTGLQEQARLDAELARQQAEEEDRRQQQVSLPQVRTLLLLTSDLTLVYAVMPLLAALQDVLQSIVEWQAVHACSELCIGKRCSPSAVCNTVVHQ